MPEILTEKLQPIADSLKTLNTLETVNTIQEILTKQLQPIADFFKTLDTPAIIVHWGHPLMMAIVVFVIGSVVGLTGWRSRVLATGEEAEKSRGGHRQAAPLLFLFITLGYSGGLISLLMQGKPILESPHFWTGSSVILLLGLNGVISATGFIGNKSTLRTVHAYLGSIALMILFGHALLGLKLGLSF